MSQADCLKERTASFALRIVRFCQSLPRTWEARRIGDQLLACGTSVGANYRAACRARSKLEFIAKIGIVIEEADESCFWLTLIERAALTEGAELKNLLREADELVAVFTASQKTARFNLRTDGGH